MKSPLARAMLLRNYKVLLPDNMIAISSQTRFVYELGEMYKPIIIQHKESYPVPIEMAFEARYDADSIILTYHIIWTDEIHPVNLINRIYGAFRLLYYGSMFDVERIHMRINRETGLISSISFETERDNRSRLIPAHATANAILQGDGSYVLYIAGQAIRTIRPILLDGHICMKVISWNHEFQLVDNIRESESIYWLPLHYLDDTEYVKGRYALRASTIRRERLIRLLAILLWFTLIVLSLPISHLILLMKLRPKIR